MSLCIALVPSHEHPNAWLSCRRVALRGDRLCRQHRDAADGIVMGHLAREITLHAKILHEIATDGARVGASEFIERTWIDIGAPGDARAGESAWPEGRRKEKRAQRKVAKTAVEKWFEEKRRGEEVSPASPPQLQPADR